MPAYMAIGEYDEESGWVTPEIKGDVSGSWHDGWIWIKSYSVHMKTAKARLEAWNRRTGAGRETSHRDVSDRSARGLSAAEQEKKKKERKEGIEENTLTIGKPRDISSTQIADWVQNDPELEREGSYAIQVDLCTVEEELPYLSLTFLGITPKSSSLQGEDSDSLEFIWERALVCTWEVTESGEVGLQRSNYAEFGVPAAKGGTTAADRGISDNQAPTADPNASAGSGKSGQNMYAAIGGTLPPVPEESITYEQERRKLSVADVGEVAFELESFRVEERLSALFSYDLEMRSTTLDIEPKDIVGHDITFKIEDEENAAIEREERNFGGVVAHFLIGQMSSDRRRRYYATVYPSVWRLTQTSNSRVFQDVTVQDVVESVFSDAGFSDYDMSGVTKTHPTMTYCVQYQESDFAFISRLLEVAGIFYYFTHDESGHQMMLCDSPAGYVDCPEDLEYATDFHLEPRVTSWRKHYEYVPGKFTASDFNFETPNEPVKVEATTQLELPDSDKAEIFEYPGRFPDSEEGTTVVERRLQARETGHVFIHAVGCYDSISPGMTITVAGRPAEDESADSDRFLITGIRHFVEQTPEYGVGIVRYRNVFTAIPEDTPFVPPRRTPKPVVHGPQTAIVVGAQSDTEETVDTDEYGRIKVQFHWDRHHEKDTDSSCWMRVAQPTAGSGYGSVFLPRIGWEVVVSFLNGDPDRPLVTGVVYNELHKPYHELPAAKHKTVIMSRSWPDGGKENFNELTFHDEKDAEEIYMHAERDFKRVVEHDDILEVGEKEEGSQTITIEGNQTTTINTGNRELSIVEGTDTSTIKGDRTVTIEEGADDLTVSQGDQSMTVSSGSQTMTISSGDQTIDVSAGSSNISAGTAIELKVGGNSITIDTSSITLTVGGSEVKLDNMGVEVKGMNVKAKADMQAEIKGMMTKVAADAMLQTEGGITMMQ